MTKVCGHLAKGDFDGGQINHRAVALICFFVARGDSPECFEIAEEVFDEVPPAVGVEVTVDRSFTVRFGRDHSNGAPVVELRPEPVGVKGLVAQEHAEFHALDQRLYPNEIVGLPRQQNETNKISQRIHQRDDLRRQSATRTSDRLTMSPPLAPVPCWWTRTIVPSIMAYSKSGAPDNRSKRTSKTP